MLCAGSSADFCALRDGSGPLAQRDGEFERFAVAQTLEVDRAARPQRGHLIAEHVVGLEFLAVDLQDHVVALEPGLVGGRVLLHLSDDHAARLFQAQRLRQIRRSMSWP